MNALIEFDIPAEPLSLNKLPGPHPYMQKKWRAQKNEWKNAAYYATVAAFPGVGPEGRRMPPCDVFISIPVVGNYRRDAHNLELTIKPIVDAIVDAGVWPDDTDQWVTMHPPTMRPSTKNEIWREKVYVRLVPREEG